MTKNVQRVSPAWYEGSMWFGKSFLTYVQNTRYREKDTGRVYEVVNNPVNVLRLIDESIRQDRGYHEHQDSSIADLYGDTFAHTQPAYQYLLEDNGDDEFETADPRQNSLSSFATTVNYVESITDPLLGYNVAQFTSSSLLARDDNTMFGTDSFLIGGWFRPDALSTSEPLLFYGNTADDYISVEFNSVNELVARINIGTDLHSTSTSSIDLRDQQWHYIGLLVDRTKNKAYLIASNQQYEAQTFAEFDISPTLGSLNGTNSAFALGGQKNSNSYSTNYIGDISNVQIYKWTNDVDYNVLPLLLAGIREGCANAITTSITTNNNRLTGGTLVTHGDVGAYTYALVNLDEGIYNVFITDHLNSDHGAYQIFIDNIFHGVVEQYSANPINNGEILLDSVKLTKGFHFIKLQHDTPNSSSTGNRLEFSNIKFVKKDGSNVGGASNFVLFGNELRRRSAGLVRSSGFLKPWYNSMGHLPSGTVPDGAFIDGEIFVKGGLYKITLNMGNRSDGGIVDFTVNGVGVFHTDTYTAGIQQADLLNTETAFVRLAQGRNVLGLKVNGKNDSSSGYRMTLHSIRADLQANSSFSDISSFFGYDDPVEEIVGNTTQTAGAGRFGQLITGTGFEHSYRIKKWFTGGVYKARAIYSRGENGGRCAITVDDISIFDDIQCNYTSNVVSTYRDNIVSIPRGYHYVTVTHNDSSNNGNDDTYINAILFDLITRLPVGGDSDLDTKEDVGGLKVLGVYVAPKRENSAVIDLGGVTLDEYEEISMLISSRVPGNSEFVFALNINDINSVLYQRVGVGNVSGIDINENTGTRGSLELNRPVATNGNYSKGVRIALTMTADDNYIDRRIEGNVVTATTKPAFEHIGWSLLHNITELTKMAITATGGNWEPGTAITIYGRRRLS